MLALLVLVLELERTKEDRASVSSKISATSSESDVRGGKRGTMILIVLRTDGVVVMVVLVGVNAGKSSQVLDWGLARGELQGGRTVPCQMHWMEEVRKASLRADSRRSLRACTGKQARRPVRIRVHTTICRPCQSALLLDPQA